MVYCCLTKDRRLGMPIRYAAERDKAGVIRQLTTLTVEEFEALVPSVQSAFLEHMSKWTLEGKPRTGRRYSQYANCPLPTPEDRLLFVLMYLKVAHLQVAHGALFDMSQSNANKWLHVLLVVLHQTLLDLGDAPARHLVALAQRLADLRQAEQPTEQASSPATPPPFYHDGSERPITRPQDAEEQKAYDSGKKKRHTVTNVLLADEDCTIHMLSDTYR